MRELVLDLSSYDKGIDLAAWKSRHHVWGTIVKVGGDEDKKWGRYTHSWFKPHYEASKNLGLHVGGYYYCSATTVEDARASAKHFVSIVKGYDFDLPLYVDIEDKAKQAELSSRLLTDIVKAFLEIVKAAGYMCGIYTATSWLDYHLYPSELKTYELWLAHWAQSIAQRYSYAGLWQQGLMHYDGTVEYDDLDNGGTDFNWCYIDYPSIIKGGGKMSKLFDPAEEIAELHAWMCTDPAFGYNIDRPGGMKPTGMREFRTTSGRTYRIMGGDYSCSTSIITVTKAVFARTKYAHAFDAATFTGDMRAAYVSSGLYEAKYSPAKRGDIYLNEGVHTALCQDSGNDGVFGYDCLSEFNRSEDPNDRYHGKSGDQDGYESVIRAYYDDNWNIILHYIGGLIEDLMWEDEDKDKESVIEVTMPILFTAKEINKVYYWNGDPECVPYHVSPAERDAIIEVYGIKVRVLSLATVNALLGMGKARKAWREEGIKAALISDTIVG